MISFKKRLLWADVIRTVAIFLVVLIHCSSSPSKPEVAEIPVIIAFALAKIGVPLFVVLSGALLLGKQEPYKLFFTKRLTRIVFPWIFWTTVTLVVTEQWQSVRSFSDVVVDWYHTLRSFWFPPLILGLYLLTPALRVFVQSAKNRDLFFLFSMWFLGLSVLPYYDPTLAFPIFINGLIPQVVTYVGYFLAGALIVRLRFSPKMAYVSGVVFLVGILLTAFAVWLSLLHKGSLPIDQLYGPAAPGIVMTTIGLFCILYAGIGLTDKKMKPHSVQIVFAKISATAFGIYLMHPLLMRFFTVQSGFIKEHLGVVAGSFIYAGILTAVSALIIILLGYIPGLKRIVS